MQSNVQLRCIELAMLGRELTFAGIGRILLGKLGFSVVMSMIAIAQLGCCIAYVVIVIDTFVEVQTNNDDDDNRCSCPPPNVSRHAVAVLQWYTEVGLWVYDARGPLLALSDSEHC